jgi:NitT/TauT family transport system ATP-binding protein
MNGGDVGGTAQIALREVSKSFDTRMGERLALDDVSFAVRAGETATVIGPTGCGKTTILNMVAGFTMPTRGKVLAGGVPVTEPGPDRGFMFQRPTLLPWMTVFDNVAFPCRYGHGLHRERTGTELGEAVMHYLDSVGLRDARDLHPHQMSGGMQSRAALARLLIAESSVLLMDEPFAALDAQTRLSMQQLLKRVVKSEGLRTVLFITHDVEEALLISDHVFLMSASPGRILRHVEVPFGGSEDYRDVVLRPEFNQLKHELIDQLERLVPA